MGRAGAEPRRACSARTVRPNWSRSRGFQRRAPRCLPRLRRQVPRSRQASRLNGRPTAQRLAPLGPLHRRAPGAPAGERWCCGSSSTSTGRSRPRGSVVCWPSAGSSRSCGGWLRNEIDGWADIVATLGGVWFRVETHDPDTDLGPVLARVDAPLLVLGDRHGRRGGSGSSRPGRSA